jgi:3',5'-cyclic-nucleotide phosphodiesterase
MARLAELESISTNLQPTLVILETLVENEYENEKGRETHLASLRTLSIPKGRGRATISVESNGSYGLSLLAQISDAIFQANLSKLIVPIAMLSTNETGSADAHGSAGNHTHQFFGEGLNRAAGIIGMSEIIDQETWAAIEPRQMLHCLDAGAVDVLTSPLQHSRVRGLPVLAYRAYKDTCQDRTTFLATKSLRKRSWVGFEERKPYAYLREDMYVLRGASFCWREGFDKFCVLIVILGYLAS